MKSMISWLVLLLVGSYMFFALILPSPAEHNTLAKEQQVQQVSVDVSDDTTQEKVERKITQQEIVQLTDAFMNTILQDIDMNYRVENHSSKESLFHEFEKITTKKVAKPYVDYYFYEENDGLYIVPTETPPWFIKQNDYDVVQLDRNKVLVTQENKSGPYGHYTIGLEFTFDDQAWKITEISHQ
ncbi:hypothetical protein [Ornithinibacillus xuwenensis]|uniref:DUF3993 domain-containing protein n=1 Tax=Ornithinibacillus xuwenensis TaxID=3144668 RepID=A0ABU9XJ41_9BACI